MTRALATAFLGAWLAMGCAETNDHDRPPPATVEEQLADGRSLFANRCSQCHGSGGQGSNGPRLIGLEQGALGTYGSAAELSQFVRTNMPPGASGSLGAVDDYAIIAFILQANGVEIGKKPIDDAVAPSISIHGGPAPAPAASTPPASDPYAY